MALRLINLGGRSLWYDEAFAVLFSEKGLDAMLYGTLTPVSGGAADIHPLLYYSTLNVWMAIFGEGAFAVRLWSVVLGVTTVGMMYVLGRDLFGQKTGLAAALITAVMPFQVQYSQEARMYALLGLLLMVATWCVVRGSRLGQLHLSSRDKTATGFRVWWQQWGWWLAFGVLAALAMYTQQLAAFYLVALGLVPLLLRRRDLVLKMAFGTLVAVIVYLPWLVNLPSQFGKVSSYYWLSKPTMVEILLTIRSFLGGFLEISAPGKWLVLIGSFFVFLLLLVQALIDRRRLPADQKPLLLVLWLALFPPLLLWLVSQVQPVYLIRALLPSALVFYLALGWLFTRSRAPLPIRMLIGLVVLALAGLGLYNQYTWATFPNSPFQPAAAQIRQDWQAGDVVVHLSKLSALPMVYYDRKLPQRFIRDLPGSSEDTLALPTQEVLGLLANESVAAAAGQAERVWWVMFDFAEREYEKAHRPELREALAWLNSHYTETGRWHFNDLVVIRYEGG